MNDFKAVIQFIEAMGWEPVNTSQGHWTHKNHANRNHCGYAVAYEVAMQDLAKQQKAMQAMTQAHSMLTTLAAAMARGDGLPSCFPDDHAWPKTTPKRAYRIAMSGFEKANDTGRHWSQAACIIRDLLAPKQSINRQ